MDTKEKAELINKALDENKALESKLAERDQEIARLREHLNIQEREIAALQAELGGKRVTAGTERQETDTRVDDLVKRWRGLQEGAKT